MLIKKLYKNKKGDTIVEVLISIAIMSLILSISYALSNKDSQYIQQSRERSEAQKISEQQLELLRSYLTPDTLWGTTPANSYNCFDESGQPVKDPTPPGAADTICGKGTDHRYRVNIAVTATDTYTVTTNWDSLTNVTGQSLALSYKLPATALRPVGTPPPPPPTLVVSLTANGDTGTVTVVAGDTINLSWSTDPTGASCTGSASTPLGGFAGVPVADHGNVSQPTTVSDSGNTYTYTVDCTLSGVSDSQTVTVNVTPPQYAIKGIDYQSCQPLESWGCGPGSTAGSVTDCQNYQASYKGPASMPAGRYTLTINYEDFNCGAPTPPSGSYTFNITVYVNGTKINPPSCRRIGPRCLQPTLNLNPAGGNANVNLGVVPAGSTIKIMWNNNQWVSDGSNPYAYDPDFQINKLILTLQ